MELCERCSHLYTMYILPLSKPFEIFMRSLGTQIMLPHQFVECLDQVNMLLKLLYHIYLYNIHHLVQHIKY